MTSQARPAPRTRVLQVTEDLGVGGLERVVATLARGLDRSRFEAQVVCLRDKGPLADALEADGIRVHCLGYGFERPDYMAFSQLRGLLRRERIDVLHTHNTNALIAGFLGALLAGGRRIVHTDHARAHPDKWRYYVAEHIASYGVHRMVGVSPETTAALRKHEWIPQRKLVTIENGIDEAPHRQAYDLEALRASLGIAPGVPVVGLMARLTRQKGITHLLRAMPRVARAVPGIVLVIAGDGPERGALEAQAREAGIADNVRFLGVRHDGAALMRLFDLYLLPSEWEGLPLAILECMAAGTPIVATAVGGIPSVLTDGESAALVAPGDDAALASRIEQLLAAPDLGARYAAAARRTFDGRFASTIMIRRYESLYLGGTGT